MRLWFAVGLVLSSALAGEAPLGHPDFVPTPEHPVGFRGDGTGCYPGATPPTEWEDKYGPELGKNVLWKTPMPGWTNSSPIVVGNRVFTLAEPDLLLCLDAQTGRLLWQKQVDHLVLWPADEAKKAREAWNQEEALRFEFWTLYSELQLLDGMPKHGGTHPPVKVPDAQARKERILKTAREQGFALSAADNQHLQAGYDLVVTMYRPRLKGAAVPDQARKHLLIRGELYTKYGFNFEQWRGWIGHTCRTPASDGKFIYVAMAFGQVACYDLDGNLKWMQWLKPGGKDSKADKDGVHPGQECGSVPSPLLAGNKLIVFGGGNVRANRLCALDKDTGKVVWETVIGGAKRDAGSPLAAKVGGEEIILLAQGRAVRAADGKVLDGDLIKDGGTRIPSMALNGNVAFFNWCVNHDAKPNESYLDAVKLDSGGDGFSAARLWRATVPRANFVGATYHNGMLYVPGSKMYVVNAADGAVSEKLYPRETFSECYGITPPSVAGDKVFWGSARDASILLTSLGKELPIAGAHRFQRDAESDFDGLIKKGAPALDEYLKKYGMDKDRFPRVFSMCSGPFFQGPRMYVRTSEYLYCIGPK